MGEIMIELFFACVAGLFGTWLIWILFKKKKIDFGVFLDKYGYVIGFITLIAILILIGLINTL